MPVPGSISELSTTAAGNYPAGTEAVFPNLDDYLRAHAAFIAQVRDLVGEAAPSIGLTQWWGGTRASIPEKYTPQDGQLLSRASYPSLWALVSSGSFPLINDAQWSANPGQRGCFSTGDGATTFRMPDLNGKQGGSVGAVVLRGDGGYSTGASGGIQDSDNLAHTHSVTINPAGGHSHSINDPGHAHTVQASGGDLLSGGGSVPRAYTATQTTSYSGTGISINGVGDHAHGVSVTASGGNETRGKSVTGVWIIRAR